MENKRKGIKNKSDIEQIVKLTAEGLGLKDSEVRKEINYFWVDIDLMLGHCCGHSVYIPNFGSFLMYTKGIYGTAVEIEKRIKRFLVFVRFFERKEMPLRKQAMVEKIADLMSRLILLDYSVELYKNEVLQQYPKKYEIAYYERYKAVLNRVEKLFNIPLAKFPITVNYPVQALFVRSLRRKRILRNPVVSKVHIRRKRVRKDKDPEMQ